MSPVLIFTMQNYLLGLEAHRTEKCNDILEVMKHALGQTSTYARIPAKENDE